MNWYVESTQIPTAPTEAALYPTPGTRPFLQVTDVGARGGTVAGDRAFVVVGGGFYEIFADGTYITRGTVAQDANPATLSYNGSAGGQVFITSGTHGYCYTLATNVLTQVLTGVATMGGMLSARFLAFDVRTGRVQLSNQNDGTAWDPTLYFARTQAPDPWQAMLVVPPNIWMIGAQTGEVWYDSGAFPQPFAPITGAFFAYGTPAPFSAAVAGDYVTWVATNKDGATQVIAAKGYTPAAISNFAVENALSEYARTAGLADAEVLPYGSRGHEFACFAFPTARATWCFDFRTGQWHQRGDWNGNANRYDAWSPRVHLAAFGRHLVGSRTSAVIAELDETVGTNADGSVIRRLRVPPPLLATYPRRLAVDRLQLLVEPGLGVAVGQGSDPQVMARFSSDAKTWSSEVTAPAGRMGEYHRRVVFTRCGSSDLVWVPEITVSDPVPWKVAGADVLGGGLR